jgi:hypothetical protein
MTKDYKIGKIYVHLMPAFDLSIRDIAYGISFSAELIREGLEKQSIHCKEYSISRSADIEEMANLAESSVMHKFQTTLRALKFTQQEIDEKIPDRATIKNELLKAIAFLAKRNM